MPRADEAPVLEHESPAAWRSDDELLVIIRHALEAEALQRLEARVRVCDAVLGAGWESCGQPEGDGAFRDRI